MSSYLLKYNTIIVKTLAKITLAIFLLTNTINAQDCSVNAGVSETICENNLSYTLSGSTTGLMQSLPQWSQIAGPPVIINDPTNLNTPITGLAGKNSYTFRLSATCNDGSTQFQDVVINTSSITKATTSDAIFSCPDKSKTIIITGNSPLNSGETGSWSIVGRNNAGVIIHDKTATNSPISLIDVYAGTSIVRWTIKGPKNSLGQYCKSYADISITNYGGKDIVDAGPDQNLNHCYTLNQETNLKASFGGNNINNQQGAWSLISGPNIPTIESPNNAKSKITNLIAGTYVLKWTVNGPCVTDSDTMSITVAPATQEVTDANVQYSNIKFCDASIDSATLVGAVPEYTGETVLWTQTLGPPATIENPNNTTTQVTGLDGNSNYQFSYRIANGTTSCSNTTAVNIEYANDPLQIVVNNGDDIIPNCGITSVDIPYTETGNGKNGYSIISGPSTSNLVNPNGFKGITKSPLSINFDKEGTYTILFKRAVTGDVLTGCDEATDAINVTISAIPTRANAGTGQTLSCNVTETSLTGNIVLIGTSLWSQIDGPSTATITEPYARQTAVKNLIPGTYTFRYNITGGGPCDPPAQSDVKITVPSSVTVTSNAGADQNVCFGSSVQLNANMPPNTNVTGTWSVASVPFGANIIFDDINDPNTKVSGLNLPDETYNLKWTIANPNNPICPYPDEDIVSIKTNSTEGPTIANAGKDQCLPSGTKTVTLSGNSSKSDETGTWTAVPSTGINFTDANKHNTTVTITKEQNYILTWTIDKCQSSSDDVEITVGNAIANAGTDATICASEYLMKASSYNGTGMWSLISGPGGFIIDDETKPTAKINFTFSGQYVFQWTVTNGSCNTDSDLVTLDVGVPTTIATVGANQSICNANTTTLSGNNFDANTESGVWTLLSGAPNTPVISDVNNPNTSISNLVSGAYIFRWTISGNTNCIPSYADITINVFTPAYAGEDQQLCMASNLILEATFGSTGTWTQVDGPGVNGNTGNKASITQNPPNSNLAEVTITPGNTYVFEFTTDYPSCTNTSDTVIITSSNGTIAIPNAGTDQVLCNIGASTSITLDGNEPLAAGFNTTLPNNSAFWRFSSVPNGSLATITNSYQHNSTLNNLTIPGTYILEWNFSTENCTEASDVVKIEVFEPLEANAGPNQTNACQLNATLNAAIPKSGNGEWTVTEDPSNGAIKIDNPNSPSSTLSNITSLGTYKLTWTVSNGNFNSGSCKPASDIVEITFTGEIPSIAEAGLSQQLCNVTQTSLNATVPLIGTGMWSQTLGPGITEIGNKATIVDKTNPTTNIENLITGTYEFTWTNSNGGCSLTDTVEVINYAAPINANAGEDQTLDEFSIATLNATPATIGTGKWTQIAGPTTANFVDIENPNTAVLSTTVGTYIFEWTVTNGACATTSDTVEITFNGGADLELSSTVLPLIANKGDIATFTIIVTNNNTNGSADATGVAIKSSIPDGYTIITNSISNGGIYNTSNNTIIWSNITIPNGNQLEITFDATVKDEGTYEVITEVVASNEQDRDSTVDNNLEAEDDQDITGINLELTDLELHKEASIIDVNINDTVTFSIIVFNNAAVENGDATGVSIVDYLPSGYTLMPETISNDGIFNETNATITWSNLSIPNGNTSILTYDIIVNANESYKNRVEIVAVDQKDPDSKPNNGNGNQTEDDESSAYVVPITTDLAITKTVNNATPRIEDDILFTITVNNIGDADATNIGINELIPTGYTYINSQASVGDYDALSGFWSIPMLASKAMETLIITVQALKKGEYLNTASLAFLDQLDLNISNDTATATVAPTCVKVYNQFSPNDDGVNDYFYIDCLAGYPNNSLKIYDRWGTIVYEEKNYKNNWKGHSSNNSIVKSGEMLPVGTYYYVLDLGNGSSPIIDWLYLKL